MLHVRWTSEWFLCADQMNECLYADRINEFLYADQMNESLYADQAMGTGATARQPETAKGNEAPQYFGTVVYDPTSASNLPVLEW